MRTLRLIFLITFPLIVVSCNNQSKHERITSSSKETGGMGDSYVAGSSGDDFIKEAGSGGLMEVELGQYAEQNAQNPRVKKYGSMMVKDHSKANEELKAIADKKNATISLNDKHQGMMRELQQKSGAEFDKDYMKMMVDDHRKDIEEFEKQAKNEKDPDLKAFASKTLPVLQTHQDSAKSIRDALK